MRCYFMRGGHIAAVDILENVAGDDDAICQATAIFLGRMGEVESFEVWDQSRFVYRCLGDPPLKPAA